MCPLILALRSPAETNGWVSSFASVVGLFDVVGMQGVFILPFADRVNEVRPGGPGRLPAQGSHRPVLACINAYGSSNHGFAPR